jgi:predicted glycosyltransferase involved in capsule biosynthesis
MDQFPDSTIYYADKEEEIFNVSGSRNQGCLSAIKDDCDMLLVVDADTLLSKESVESAISKAVENDCVCLPYTTYNRLYKQLSTSLIDKEKSYEDLAVYGADSVVDHPGGAYVMSSSTFLLLNGWDQRFVGWGYEDDAFLEAHRVYLGKDIQRVEGYALSLFHMDRDQDYMEQNRQRFDYYKNRSKEEMVEIIRGNIHVE